MSEEVKQAEEFKGRDTEALNEFFDNLGNVEFAKFLSRKLNLFDDMDGIELTEQEKQICSVKRNANQVLLFAFDALIDLDDIMQRIKKDLNDINHVLEAPIVEECKDAFNVILLIKDELDKRVHIIDDYRKEILVYNANK